MQITKLDFLIDRFKKLDKTNQEIYLSKLIITITILSRYTYDTGNNSISYPEELRVYNEIQHQISQQLYNLINNDKNTYPIGVFFNILVDYLDILNALNSCHKVIKFIL